jgi:ABC-type transport system involved in cytochrome c biogenesis permease subunit
MHLPDLINGLFESLGGIAVLLSCFKLLKDKQVKGVSVYTVFFFTSWGIWNMWYYPSMGQRFSGYAAIATCVANCFWICLIILYSNRKKAIGKLKIKHDPAVWSTCCVDGTCTRNINRNLKN